MRISPIVMRLRAAFDNFLIAGAAELDIAVRGTLKKDMMFVVPISEESGADQHDSSIEKPIDERFAVIVAIANDVSDREKTGIRAYDNLHEIRSKVFRAFLGWQIVGPKSIIDFRGGNLWGINNAYLWYQWDFEIQTQIEQYDGYWDVAYANDPLEGEFRETKQISQIDELNSIYANYIMWPSANLPWTDDDMPDSSLVDMAQIVDLTEDPDAGEFGRGFGNGFDFYKILNRK